MHTHRDEGGISEFRRLVGRVTYGYHGYPNPWVLLSSDNGSSRVFTEYEDGDHSKGRRWRPVIRSRRPMSSSSHILIERVPKGNDGYATLSIYDKILGASPGPESVATLDLQGMIPDTGYALKYAPPYDQSALYEDANRQALEKFVVAAKRATRSVQGGVIFGEFGKTLRAISNPVSALRSGIFDYLGTAKKRASGRRTPKKRKRDIVAETWLEYNCGWAPLISDIEGTAKALAKASTYRCPSTYVLGRGSSEHNLRDYGAYSQQFAWIVVNHGPAVRKEKVTVVYRGSVGVLPDSTTGSALRQDLGVTFRDFVPTLWELVPYSFLVDYFSNVGNVLEALTFNSSQLHWCNKTTIYETTCERPVLPNAIEPAFINAIFQHYGPLIARPARARPALRREIFRINYGTSFVPSLAFEIPGIKSKKWLNIAALGITHRDALRSINA